MNFREKGRYRAHRAARPEIERNNVPLAILNQFIDAENLTSAEHYTMISLFEINNTEDSEAAYQLIKQEYENQTTINVIDVGTDRCGYRGILG